MGTDANDPSDVRAPAGDVFESEYSSHTAAGKLPPRSGRRVKALLVVFLVLASLLVAGALLLRGKQFVIVLTQEQIQEKLDARFPIDKSYLEILQLTLSDPKVELVEGGDRVTFGLKAVANIHINDQARPLSGKATVTTGLRYEPADCSFYLDDPVVDKVEIEGLPVKHVGLVNRLARGIAQERINRTRVYTLDQKNVKQTVTRAVLKSLVVKDGKLIITLGLYGDITFSKTSSFTLLRLGITLG